MAVIPRNPIKDKGLPFPIVSQEVYVRWLWSMEEVRGGTDYGRSPLGFFKYGFSGLENVGVESHYSDSPIFCLGLGLAWSLSEPILNSGS